MKKRLSQQNGFTMIELLIYMSLVTVGLVILTSFLVDVTKNAVRAKTAREMQQNARLVITRLTQDIKTADSVDYVSPDTDDHGSIIIKKNGSTLPITYAWNNDQISYSYNSVTSSITTDTVSVPQLRFEQNGNAISIQLTVQQLNNSNNQIVLSSTAVPRNTIY